MFNVTEKKGILFHRYAIKKIQHFRPKHHLLWTKQWNNDLFTASGEEKIFVCESYSDRD